MSHFTVLVIGDDIKSALAPFQENNMGDCPQKYLTFHETETEMLENYKTGSVEMVRCEDGALVYKWDERFRVAGAIGIGSNSHEVPKHLAIETIKHADRFATFEEFCSEWHSSEERDEKTGRFGYWENPNRKWDWYSVGGRWRGMIRLKGGEQVDTAKVGDIDLEGMRKEAEKKAAERYDVGMKAVGHTPPNETWESMPDGPDKHESYWAQPRCVAWFDAKKNACANNTDWPFDLFGGPDELLIPRAQYIQNAGHSAFTTFAVLKDGNWYERGKMGWWACLANEKDQETWASMFQKLLSDLPPETTVTVVDCHI